MENLQEFIYINDLLVIYGKTLTEKQQVIMESYYVFNLSLQEIATNLGISKAGVSDAIKVSIKHLENLEHVVGHLAYKNKTENLLAKIEEETTDEHIKKLLSEDQDGI